MKIWKSIGFVCLIFVFSVIFDITGASPADFILSGNLARTINVALIPFSDIADVVATGNTHNILRNIGGNIALFMPLGFILPLFWTGFRKPRRTVLFGLCVSVGIEISQLFNWRATVTDDILLNTVGTLLGFLCATAVLRLLPRLFPNDPHERRFLAPAVLAAVLSYAILTMQDLYYIQMYWR